MYTRIVRMLLLGLFLLCQQAPAQELLLQDGLNGDFYSVDPQSGQAQFIGGPSMFLYVWGGLATDSQGRILTVGWNLQTPNVIELYEVNSSTGQVTPASPPMNTGGISSLAFGPNDILYATIGDFRFDPVRYHLFSVTPTTGTLNRIGRINLDGILAMDFDGTTMFVWDGYEGLHTINLQTAQASDVNPGFLGSIDLSKSMCFSDNGTLYAFDVGLWTMEPTTGVGSFSGVTWPNISGGMEYIPGPNQVLSLWQTEQVGNPTELKVRGATPNGQVAILLSDGRDGTTLIPQGVPCAGTILDLHPGVIRLSRLVDADSLGEVVLGPTILPAGSRGDLRIQALDLTTCVKSNRIEVVW